MTQIQKKKLPKVASKNDPMKPVRLQLSTLKKLTKILEIVNKKDFGKKVRPDALVELALSLVGVKEIEILRHSSMTNADRLEEAYRAYAAKADGISKDEFLGLLLAGKVSATSGDGVKLAAVEMEASASMM